MQIKKETKNNNQEFFLYVQKEIGDLQNAHSILVSIRQLSPIEFLHFLGFLNFLDTKISVFVINVILNNDA